MPESKITCPNCGNAFNAEDAIAKGLEEKLTLEFQVKNRKAAELLELKNQEVLKKLTEVENLKKEFDTKQEKAREEYVQKLKEDREKIALEAKVKAEKEASDSVAIKLKDLTDDLEKKKRENLELQKKELDFLKKELELKEAKEKMDLDVQKQILEARKKSEEELSKRFAEQFELKEKEYKKQLEDQKKLADDMKRKMEQGSMQMQGEVQELVIEEELKSLFPFDLIEEVSKGIRGADCVQLVRNNLGDECGKIIYESKRTKAFANDWIPKLKEDMRASGCDVAVLITETLPKDQNQFAFVNGVWVCSFSEFKALANVLREGILSIHQASTSNENKGEKMQLLYRFLTGNEFRQHVEAIVEGFSSLREDLEKEKRAMNLIWKKREKQIDKVMHNTTQLYGSVKGIAGASLPDIEALTFDESKLLDDFSDDDEKND